MTNQLNIYNLFFHLVIVNNKKVKQITNKYKLNGTTCVHCIDAQL